jgi:hypothetical protein
MNKFDRTITQGKLLAEILCRRKPRAAWSIAIATASRTVKFWKILISGLTTAVDVSPVLQQIGTFLKWDVIPFDTSLTDAQACLTAAHKDIRACRKNATELRQSFLDDRIEAAAQAEDTTKEKLLKKLRHREAQSACFAKLANALKPAGNRGGVTKVELEIDGEVVACTKKHNVEHITKNRNEKHFDAAAGTPFTVYPLSNVGVTKTAFKTSHLPDGTAVKMPADTFLKTETLFDLGAAFSNISSRISLQDFVSAITVWKERTSASPSGRHLGHCKLLVRTYENKNAPPAIRAAAGDILNLMVDMLDLASVKGFMLEC